MPLPQPESANEVRGVLTHGLEHRRTRQGKRSGVKGSRTKMQERNHQHELQRVDEVISQLRGSDIEAEEQSGQQAEYCRTSEQRINAYQNPDRDAPG